MILRYGVRFMNGSFIIFLKFSFVKMFPWYSISDHLFNRLSLIVLYFKIMWIGGVPIRINKVDVVLYVLAILKTNDHWINDRRFNS